MTDDRAVRVERAIIQSFENLLVSAIPVVVHVGHPHDGLVLRGEANVLEKIRTSVEGDTLIVSPKAGASYSTDVPLEVEFATPRLTKVSASAGAIVKIEGVAGERIELEADSGAQIKVSGQVGAVQAFAQSGAIVDISRLNSRNVSSSSSSGGTIRS